MFLRLVPRRGGVHPTGLFKIGPIDYQFIFKYDGKSVNGLNPTSFTFPPGSLGREEYNTSLDSEAAGLPQKESIIAGPHKKLARNGIPSSRNDQKCPALTIGRPPVSVLSLLHGVTTIGPKGTL